MKLTSGLLLESREFIIRLCQNTPYQIEAEFEGIDPGKRIIPLLSSIDLFVDHQSLINQFESVSPQEILKQILFKFCIKQEFIKGAWRGREHVKLILDSDLINCFQQAKLFDQSSETDNWWYTLFTYSRSIKDIQQKIDTGYQGEFNSYNYERLRTKRSPKKEFIDSTGIGYDLLSWVNETSDDRLRIEVKSSIQAIDSAKAYISKKEYHTACNQDGFHCFHFWLIGKNSPKLAVLAKHLITDLAPKEITEDFQLEKYSVSFNHFKDYFTEVNFD